MDNIVLCGFMGCGKSTVGRNIARKTGKKFLDMDTYIEKKAGMTVSEIFDKYGESGFRDMEHEACKELSGMKDLIIASGGGAFTFERNVEVFKGKDTIVLLDVPLGVIKYRLRNDKTRPLLQRPDRDKAMQELYDKRLPLYKSAADIVVSGKNIPIKTAFSVIDAVNEMKK
ncbi:shikimate kinase [Ruminococcus sp.]|uniref:shikimate kinase n=1 Tax=Ruminococcus sp. TaxID=41978 RepID=UPI002632F6B4|nr:shikimate kinase [Ruminococcus sp.]MDD6990012.1 shikimate kinase [Ruminococcus sp.]MDY6202269.1 shikimate kinase [Ruminococcus sp.]